MYVLKEIVEIKSWCNTDHVEEDVSLIVCCTEDRLAELYMYVDRHYAISCSDLESLKEYLYVADVPRELDGKLVNLDIEEVQEL